MRQQEQSSFFLSVATSSDQNKLRYRHRTRAASTKYNRPIHASSGLIVENATLVPKVCYTNTYYLCSQRGYTQPHVVMPQMWISVGTWLEVVLVARHTVGYCCSYVPPRLKWYEKSHAESLSSWVLTCDATWGWDVFVRRTPLCVAPLHTNCLVL